MKVGSHILFWVVVFAVGFFVWPLLVGADGNRARLAAELSMVQGVMGESIAGWIVSSADAMYRAIFVTTGLSAAVGGLVHSPTDRQAAVVVASGVGAVFADGTGAYFAALEYQFYGVCVRGLLVIAWLLLLLPFLVAALVDGHARRQKMLSAGGIQNPTAFSVATHMAIAMLAAPLVYVSIPVTVNPLVIPVWAVVAAVPMSIAIANMQGLSNDP